GGRRRAMSGRQLPPETQPLPGPAAEAALEPLPAVLDGIVEESRVAGNEAERLHARELIGGLVTEVVQGSVVPQRDLSAGIDARIAELDRIVSDQLNAILH